MPSNSPTGYRFPSGSCGRRWAPSAVGMEDARFVRFVDDDGSVTFYATYTAYSGSRISQQLLETTDFQSFTSSPMVGRRRRQQGPGAVSPPDSAVASPPCRDPTANRTRSPTPIICSVWTSALPCQRPTRAWEMLQLGNCGSPIETDAGWLVLTHGVGPMRTYSIGAILLDLDDPTRIHRSATATTTEPGHRRAGRLRTQCRLLMRRPGARRHAGAAVRHRRRRHRHRHRAAARTSCSS